MPLLRRRRMVSDTKDGQQAFKLDDKALRAPRHLIHERHSAGAFFSRSEGRASCPRQSEDRVRLTGRPVVLGLPVVRAER